MRTVVIGTSAIARNHLEALKTVGVNCVAICGRSNLVNLHKIAHEFDIPNTFTSWEKALSDAEFDSLVVCTPPEVSFEILNYISGRGIACLVEKPALQTEVQLEKIMKLHLQQTFMAFNRRHYKTVGELKSQIAREPLGVLTVEIHEPDITTRVAKTEAVINNSIHVLDLILYLTGSRFTDIQVQSHSSTFFGLQLYMTANEIPVSLSIKFGIPANTSLNYEIPGSRYLLRPIEQLSRFNDFTIHEPTPTSSIRIYEPSWKGSESQVIKERTERLKPGFLNQATQFKNFFEKDQIASAMTSMADATQSLQFAFSLANLL
jgi:hypothetical protein